MSPVHARHNANGVTIVATESVSERRLALSTGKLVEGLLRRTSDHAKANQHGGRTAYRYWTSPLPNKRVLVVVEADHEATT